MSRRVDTRGLVALARLQELAVLESRRIAEQAVAETDRRSISWQAAEQELELVDRAYAELHAHGRICPVRMQLAGAIVAKAGDHLDVQAQSLRAARNSEAEASADWQRNEHRTEWFANKAREAARRDQRYREAKIEDELRGVRVALSREARS